MGIVKKYRNKKAEHALNKLGFTRSVTTQHVIIYRRYNNIFNFMQEVALCEKESGIHMIHSYSDEEGEPSVGLTGIEMTCFLKKMKALGWYSKVPSTGM